MESRPNTIRDIQQEAVVTNTNSRGHEVKVRQAQKSGISHVQATLWDAENQAPEEKIFSFSLTKDQILSTDNLKASNTCPTHPSIRAYFGYLSRHE